MCKGLFDCEFLLQIDLHIVFAGRDFIILIISSFLGDYLVGGVELQHGGNLVGYVKAAEEVEEKGSFEEGGIVL